jgi:hypothetical protein
MAKLSEARDYSYDQENAKRDRAARGARLRAKAIADLRDVGRMLTRSSIVVLEDFRRKTTPPEDETPPIILGHQNDQNQHPHDHGGIHNI